MLIYTTLQGFIHAGVSETTAAAREAVKGTQQQEFASRNAALGDAVKSISAMARAATAEQASRSNIALAASARQGAPSSLLASINHVVAKETTYIGQLFGKMSIAAAMLERDFTATGTIVGRADNGAASLGGFALSHKGFGKLLSVDAQRIVTPFNQDGSAMDQESTTNTLGAFAGLRDNSGAVVDRWM